MSPEMQGAFLPMLCSVIDNARHLESPVMQMMVLQKFITQTNCGFFKLSPKPLLPTISSPFTTDDPAG